MPTDRTAIYKVQVIDRVFDLLETIAKADEGRSLTELSRVHGLPFSTVHRLVTIMSSRGYVEQDPITRKYSLGLKILELRGQLLHRLRLIEQARPIMREVVQLT